jgi:hypothetical protein
VIDNANIALVAVGIGFSFSLLFFYREAVSAQSPGLLQPWGYDVHDNQPGTGCAPMQAERRNPEGVGFSN